MEEWKTYKLSSIANLSTGFPFDGHKYSSIGTRVLRGENIGDKCFNWDERRDKRWNEKFERIDEFSLRPGDIVLQMDGNVGRNKARISNEDCPMLIAQRVACLRAKENISQAFLYYIVVGKSFKDYLDSVKTGTSIQHISLKQIGDFEVTIPSSYSEQQRIADVLQALDDKIELNNRINHNLEQQAQALYKSWFIDFEPFKDGKFVESELGMIPEGWRVGPIYEYAKVIYGAPYKSTLFNESSDGLPLIRIRDLKDCSPQFYSSEVLPNTEYVLKGDIVAGMDADFTPYIWKGNKGLLNQRVCKFVPTSDSISRYYIMMFVKPDLEFVSSYKVGTTVSHLGKSDIDKFTVILPPVEIVERYSRIADSILEQIVNNSTEAARLIEQRDSLLRQLMSGKLTC